MNATLRYSLALLALSACTFAGCVTPLTKRQLAEYQALEAKGLLEEEKNPRLAAALGILPGGGSFYTGEWGLGILNLAVWPYSILWDPISGQNAAKKINYYATKAALDEDKQAEMKRLDTELEYGTITQAAYFRKKREVEEKFSP